MKIFRLVLAMVYMAVTALLVLDDSWYLGHREFPWTNLVGVVLATAGVAWLQWKENVQRAEEEGNVNQ